MTPLETLDTLLSEMKTHTPDIAKVVGPLMSELRMIADRGFADTRNRLDLDLTNLTQGLDDVISMKRIGIVDGDIAIAEAAMMTLAIDMRSRAISIIKDRAAAIRIHAEVAAGRADPDLEPMDLTDGYRLMAAMPVDAHGDEDGLIIQSLGLPEKGGQAGRIVGDVLVGSLHEKNVYNDSAGPVETLYLPAGRSVRLFKGEQIRLHTHGAVFGDRKLTLDAFKNEAHYYDVQARADDVMVYGPMTFEVSAHEKLHDILEQSKELAKIRGQQSKLSQHLASTDTTLIYKLAGGFMSAMGIVFGVVLQKETGSTTIGLLALIPGVVSLSASYGTSMYQKKMNKNFGNRVPKESFDLLNKMSVFFSSSELPHKNIESADSLIERVQRYIISISMCRVYPLRKLIVKEREGVRVIEPLKAIAAPVPGMDLNDTTVIKMKTRA